MMHHPKFRSAVQSVMYGPRPSPDAPYAAYSPGWDSLRQGFGLQAGRSIPDAIEGHRYLAPAGDFASSLGTDPLRSIIYGAAAGGLGGAALKYFNHGAPSDIGMGAGVGALAGGGIAGLASLLMRNANLQKQAGFYAMGGSDSDPFSAIQARIFSDSTVPSDEKALLMSLLSQLSPHDASRLSEQVAGLVGAGVGAAVARFLLHMGIGGTALLGIVGGAVGSQFGGSPRNAYGQRVNTEYDPFGHRHLVF